MMRNAVITVEGITKTFGDVLAVDDISFEVAEGEIFGIVGPNGAGKTTTLDCVEGLKQPDDGRIDVLGHHPWYGRDAVRPRIGIQLQESRLQARIKVWEALDLFASFYPQPLDWEELIGPLGLAEKRNALYGDLSGGQKQRLFVALAMVGDADVLFLDELTTGLDPHARHAMWDLVRDVRERGKTVVLTTHFMEEAERLADRVAIMDHGKIVAIDTPEALIRSDGGDARLEFVAESGLDGRKIERLAPVHRVELHNGRVTVHGTGDSLTSDVTRALDDMGCRHHDMRTHQGTLEDVFLKLTGHHLQN